jgi:hypothetical protein
MSRAVALVLLVIGILTLATHLYLPKLDSGGVHRSRLLEGLEDLSSIKAADLKFRIEEMLQIKGLFFIRRNWY